MKGVHARREPPADPSRRSEWLLAVATVAAVSVIGWTAWPDPPQPLAVPEPAKTTWGASLSPFEAPAPESLVQPPPPLLPTSPLSTQVAPGVHITPLSVPTGTVPVPAGPSPNDSEPQN